MNLERITIRLEGVTLSKKQVEAAWPHIQAYHDGHLTKSQMMAKVRVACRKANVPLEIEEEEDEMV